MSEREFLKFIRTHKRKDILILLIACYIKIFSDLVDFEKIIICQARVLGIEKTKETLEIIEKNKKLVNDLYLKTKKFILESNNFL